MLRQVHEFCEKHNLQYFLSNGTLLGAIKYKGFIPWDDDIDIFIPRKDYDYFVREYKDTERFKLFSPEREAKYAFPFAKLCDMTTRKEERNNNNGVELGVDIDIFPLDQWDKDAKRHARKQVQRMLWLRLAKNYEITATSYIGKTLIKKVVAFFCKILGTTYFVKKLCNGAERKTITSSNVGCVVWPVYGMREIIPAEVFDKSIKVEFEGEWFYAPKGFDIYLRSLYGEYEKDPPLEKQKTHHRFIAYYI